MRRISALGLVVLLMIASSIPRVQASAGELDPTFGSGGIVFTDFSDSFDPVSDEFVNDTVIQPDGKIVAVGGVSNCCNGSGQDFAVVRYNPNGSLDTLFGNGGRVIIDFNDPSFESRSDSATAVALQPDGKIVVAGSSQGTEFVDFAVARLNPDGNLDTAFGNGGRVTTFFSHDNRDEAHDVVVQPDGKIILVGQTHLDHKGDVFALARYNMNGSLDASFGSGGLVMTDFSGINGGCPVGSGDCDDRANGVALQPDGRIIAVGKTSSDVDDFALARYNPNGSLDLSFGTGGKVTTDLFNASDSAEDIVLQPDGKIVAVGTTVGPTLTIDIGLARYKSDGSLDQGFGSGGKVYTDFSNHSDEGTAVALQRNGRIVVVGYSFLFNSDTADSVIARYTPDGHPDTTFGATGKIKTELSPFTNRFSSVAVTPGGKIIAGGFAIGVLGADFAIARYQGASFDICIQSGQQVFRLSSESGEYEFSDCNGSTITGTGTLTVRGCTITLQHNAPDRRVMAMVDTCRSRGTATVQTFSPRRTVNIADLDITDSCGCR